MEFIRTIKIEIDLLRIEAEEVEKKIISVEESPSALAENGRYTRLVKEKEMLVTNLCELRLRLANCCETSKNDESKQASLLEAPTEIDEAQDFAKQNKTIHYPNSPGIQVEEYVEAKKKLASIMRDFSDKKLHFKGVNGAHVFINDWQAICRECAVTKCDPYNFLMGESLVFKTSYSKKTKLYTEMTVFLPHCEHSDSKAIGPVERTTNSNLQVNSLLKPLEPVLTFPITSSQDDTLLGLSNIAERMMFDKILSD